MTTFRLDPKGYFIIRVINNKIQVGFCKYQEIHKKGGFAKNIIEDQIESNDKNILLTWLEQFTNNEQHISYMDDEIIKAIKAIETNTKYIQD